MTHEPESMAQIHRIMEALYEEEKQLTPKERLERLRKESELYLTQTGLILKRVNPPSMSPIS